MRANSLKKWGNEIPQRSEKFKQNYIKIIQDRYGKQYTNPTQVPHLFYRQQKALYSTKEYKVNNKIYTLRGYEHFALNYLINILRYTVDEVLSGASNGVPSFKYVLDKKARFYFPDFYVKTRIESFVVEVKSTYTSGVVNENLFQMLKKKSIAVTKTGQTFVLLIMGGKGEVVLDHTGVISSRRKLCKLLNTIYK